MDCALKYTETKIINWCFDVSVTLSNITQLVLSHNKVSGTLHLEDTSIYHARPCIVKFERCLLSIFTFFFLSFFGISSVVPANISELKNLEVLNMFNNQIEELPTQISSLQKLKHLNLGWLFIFFFLFFYSLRMWRLWVLSLCKLQICFNHHPQPLFFLFSMNRLSTLPRGFGSLPALEVLDLTYNNLNHSSLPGNFFYLSEWKHTHTWKHRHVRHLQDIGVTWLMRCLFLQQLFVLSISATMTLKPSLLTSRSCQSCKL